MNATAQILQQIKTQVKSTDPDATVILYGSYARGDYRADSDIDILVLMEHEKITHEDRIRITYPLYHLELETGIIISPMIFSRKQWESRHRVGPFYKNVTREGKVL